MKIAIIGASGFVGSALLTEALDRGHKVTAIVRNPKKIRVKHKNLETKKGNVLNESEVRTLVTGHDAILSAYNAGWDNPNLYNDFLAGSNAITSGAKKAGVKRLLVVGGAGSLEVAPGVQLVDTLPESKWKPGALAARDFLNILHKEKELEWTFLSPPLGLQPGERTGKYRLGNDHPVKDKKGENNISVHDLAVALLDELENKKFIRRRFTVGY
jgi:putative NADH-flavin reductase